MAVSVVVGVPWPWRCCGRDSVALAAAVVVAAAVNVAAVVILEQTRPYGPQDCDQSMIVLIFRLTFYSLPLFSRTLLIMVTMIGCDSPLCPWLVGWLDDRLHGQLDESMDG